MRPSAADFEIERGVRGGHRSRGLVVDGVRVGIVPDALERGQRGAAVERSGHSAGALAGAGEVVHPELAGYAGQAPERGG